MLHAHAALTPRQRLRLARLVVEQNWPKARAAEFFRVAWTTADRWAERYRTEGKAGMVDRTSRPHTSPAKTDVATAKRVVSLRLRKRWGAARLAAETGVAPSTAGAVLRRCGLSRLSRLERRDRQLVRYEHAVPGDLLHADVKKLGNIPAGGGWRFLGREQGRANRHHVGGRGRSRWGQALPRLGHDGRLVAAAPRRAQEAIPGCVSQHLWGLLGMTPGPTPAASAQLHRTSRRRWSAGLRPGERGSCPSRRRPQPRRSRPGHAGDSASLLRMRDSLRRRAARASRASSSDTDTNRVVSCVLDCATRSRSAVMTVPTLA